MERSTAQIILTTGFALERFLWVLAVICHCRIKATPRRRQRIVDLPDGTGRGLVDAWATAMRENGATRPEADSPTYALAGVSFTVSVHQRETGPSVSMEADLSPVIRRYDRLMGLLNMFVAPPVIMLLSLVLCFSVIPLESNVPRHYALHIFHALHVIWPSFVAVALFRRQVHRANAVLEGLPDLPGES